MTVDAIGRECRKVIRQCEGVGLVVIDYLQLIQSANRYKGNKVQEVSEISRQLKLLAKEIDLPVIVLSQLSRSVEQREIKRPYMSDLRDSGAIEQDANVILFLYYHYYYLKKEMPMKEEDLIDWEADMSKNFNKIEVIVGKNRHGREENISCYINPATATIRDLS